MPLADPVFIIFSESDALNVRAAVGALEETSPAAEPVNGTVIVELVIATALISALGRYPVKPYVTMTGELFLTGQVGRIGGLDGKIRGALEAGMTSVCIPHENAPDFHNLSATTFTPDIISKMEFVFVRTIDDVLRHALKSPNTILGENQ